MESKLKPCPFCGYSKARLQYHEVKYLGQNDFGAKKIKFTGYIVCNKCLSRGKPVSATIDNVHCYGWNADLREQLFTTVSAAWNRRADP